MAYRARSAQSHTRVRGCASAPIHLGPMANTPKSKNSSHQPPLPSDANHRAASSVSTNASTRRHLRSDVSVGVAVLAAFSISEATVLHAATASHARTSRPNVTECPPPPPPAPPAARIHAHGAPDPGAPP